MASILGKSKIAIDVAALANGDSIASYLTDAAGALLTSTLVGAKQSLDVNVSQSALPTGAATEVTLAAVLADTATIDSQTLNISNVITALSKAEDSAHASGDQGVMQLAVRRDANTSLVSADGDYAPLQVDANGALKVSGSFTITDSSVYAEDSAHVSGDMGQQVLTVRQDTLTASTSADGDYGSFKATATGEVYVHDVDVKAELVAANASLDAMESDIDAIRVELLDQGTTLDSILADTATIDSQTLSISNVLTALSKAEDAVHSSGDQGIQALAVRKDSSGSSAADGDYTSIQTWSEGSVKVVDVSNAAILQQRVAVTTTAAAVPAGALANRRSVMIQNAGGNSIFIGSATVTSSGATTGVEIPKGGFIEMEAGPAVSVFAVSASGSVNVNVLEMS